jgi:hypothetical protein
VIVIPYYLYVIDFLNPSTIIDRVRDRVTGEYGSARQHAGVAHRQWRLHERILQLGNVILRAIDRADRDVAIEAISALEFAHLAYEGPKRSAPPVWFEVSKELFPGLSRQAVAFLHAERIWVEHRFLSQLHLAYVAALARMPDAISAISRVNRKIAERARDAGDGPALDLSIRYFNTFVRTAITRRDLHAVFDVFHQYRLLAEELLAADDGRARRIARHMRYYGELARSQGLAFVHELAASEGSVLVERAYETGSPAASGLLDELVVFHCGAAAGEGRGDPVLVLPRDRAESGGGAPADAAGVATAPAPRGGPPRHRGDDRSHVLGGHGPADQPRLRGARAPGSHRRAAGRAHPRHEVTGRRS